MNKKFAIITAVYDTDLFEYTINEYQIKGYITWETRLRKLQPGDVVYIYYSNLPNQTESQILFKGEVCESNIKMTRGVIYGNSDETSVKAIKIEKLEAISRSDREKYRRSALSEEFNIYQVRGGIYLSEEHQNLITSIEQCDKQGDLQEILQYFKPVSALEDIS